MMIRTQFDITIEINDKPFVITAKRLSKAQDEAFRTRLEAITDAIKPDDERRAKVVELETEYEFAKELSGSLPLLQKPKAIMEARELFRQLTAQKAELADMNKSIENLNKTFEDVAKDRFEISISGEGKDELVRALGEHNIGYQEIMTAINEIVKEALEKK
jgi:hypothetical protein